MFGDDDLIKIHKPRADIIANIVLICFVIVLGRLWYLQIYKGKLLYRYSLENRLRKEIVKAPRGMVFSRNNQVMVYNVPRFDAIITPQYLRNKKESIKKLSKILSLPESKIKRALARNAYQARYRPVVIKKNISRREVAIIETEGTKLPGVSVQTFISREYQDREIGGHLLGYISEISKSKLPKLRKRDKYDYRLGDFIGQAGIEEEYDLKMRGRNGHQFVEVDAFGRSKRRIGNDAFFAGIENKAAIPGNNIRLTIDRDMQQQAYKSLEGKVGSVVAVDVSTGEILTMVSRPSFDPSRFSRGIRSDYWSSLINDANKPLRARTIQDHYAPGSTFKPLVAIAGLEEGLIDEKTEVKCTGSFRLGKKKYHCWKKYGHGKVDVYKAIRESCDVFFYKLATQIDIDVIAKYANVFGLGRKTGINLPRETSGLIPTKEWKRKAKKEEWQMGETLSCAIGQSFVLSTSLQLALAYGAIANGEKLYKPHLAKEIFSTNGEIIYRETPEVAGELNISPKTLDIVRKGLYQVVNQKKGTAWWYRGQGIQMAGKTGTSQVIQMSAEKIFSKCEDNEYRFRHHGIFVSYAPMNDPKIAVAVVVEHGCHGSTAAAPVARNVITTYMEKYYPELKKQYMAKERQAYLKMKAKEEKKKAGEG